MRGSSRAQLVRSGGHNYVIKYRRTSQSCRPLIAEWLGSRLFAALGLAAAPSVLMNLGPGYPQPSLDGELIPIEGHVASLCPGEDARTAIYDLFPRASYHLVVNYEDLIAALAVDIWLSNSQMRQAVFYRVGRGEQRKYQLWLVDHHGLFGGQDWCFGQTVACHHDPSIYEGVDACAWAPVLHRIENLPDLTVREIFESIPPLWADKALDSLQQTILERRFQTRARLSERIEKMRKPAMRRPPHAECLAPPQIDCRRMSL